MYINKAKGGCLLIIRIMLKELLEARVMSQHELSRRTGIRQATISEMAANKSIMIPIKNLAILCKVLECDITDVLKLEKEPSS